MPALRQSLASLALTVAAVAIAAPARGDELPVPLQVRLLSKISTYVSGIPVTGTEAILVLVVYPGGSEAPPRGAQAIASGLNQLGQFGAAKVVTKLTPFSDARSFEATLAAEKPHYVYLAPELDAKAAAGVAQAAANSPTVTVSSVGEHVRLGIILGFSLVEAKPTVLLNPKQATKQKVKFHSGLLRSTVLVDSDGR